MSDFKQHLPHYADSLELFAALRDAEGASFRPDITGRAVLKSMDLLSPAVEHLPDPDLTTMDRMTLSGYLFRFSPDMARATGRIMLACPKLFPGTEELAKGLVERADRGQAMLCVRDMLLRLAQRAWDLSLLDLGTASCAAADILRAVIAEGGVPGASMDQDLRRTELGSAIDLLETRKGKKKPKKKGRPSKKGPPPSRQQAAARAAKAEQERRNVDALLADIRLHVGQPASPAAGLPPHPVPPPPQKPTPPPPHPMPKKKPTSTPAPTQKPVPAQSPTPTPMQTPTPTSTPTVSLPASGPAVAGGPAGAQHTHRAASTSPEPHPPAPAEARSPDPLLPPSSPAREGADEPRQNARSAISDK